MQVSQFVPCRGGERLVSLPSASVSDVRLFDIAGEYTNRCFQNCRSCYGSFEYRGEEMTIEQIREIKKQFDGANITTAHLTGGEILWHRQIDKILSLFGESGYRIEIDTNGVLIDGEMAKLLSRFGVEVLVGIETIDEDLYSWYRGTDSMATVLQGLDLMLEQGMTPGIQIMVANFRGCSQEKYDPVDNILQLIKYSTGKGIPAYLVQYRRFGRAALCSDLVTDLTREQKIRLMELIFSLSADQRKLVSGDLPFTFPKEADFYGCVGGILLANMDVQGNIYLCNWLRDRKFGNLFKEDLKEIIARMKRFRLEGLEDLNCNLQKCEFRENNLCFGPCLVSKTSKEMKRLY